MNILVTGANGYVGTHLIALARKEGHEVCALMRPGCHAAEKDFLQELGAGVLENDLAGNVSLHLPAGVEAVVHLLGSLDKPPGGTYRGVHESKTRFLLSECRRLKVKKIVYLGTLGAGPSAPSEYLRSKWLGEEEVKASGMEYAILRSPLIFGKTCGVRESKVIRRMREMVQTRPKLPILGSGRNRLQPIFVGDVTRCLLRALGETVRNETIDLGGPEQLTFEQVVDAVAHACKVQKRKVHIPLPIAALVAACMERGKDTPLITRDQVRMMRHDVLCRTDRMEKVFGAPLVRLREAL